MNPFSGHLIALDEKALPTGYERLPQRLEAEAARALGGQKEVHVALDKPTPLADWAKKKRRAKIAARSRRRNR